MNPPGLLKGHPYTPVKDMGPDYLQRKFAKIRRELKEQQRQSNVEPIKRKAA